MLKPSDLLGTRLARAPSAPPSAASLLGPRHPLARAIEMRRALIAQSAVVAVLLATAVAGAFAGVPSAGALIASALAAQLALAGGLLMAAAVQRHHSRELIAEGRGGLPLRCVQSERQRLVNNRYVLACAVDRVRATAERPGWSLRPCRPLFRPETVATVAPALREIAERLRASEPDPVALALVSRLLCDGASPLYGDDVSELRDAVELLRRRLRG